MNIDLKTIKPKVRGQSDKYSWNLYNFLHKITSNKTTGKYVENQLKIYWLTRSRWDGSYVEFDKNHIQESQIIIVPYGDNGSSFYNLSVILRENRAKEWALIYKRNELIDITNWFFSVYAKDGRCIFDRNHNGWFLGDKDRFTYINNTRRCNWCGEWHKKEIHKVVKIKREVQWI